MTVRSPPRCSKFWPLFTRIIISYFFFWNDSCCPAAEPEAQEFPCRPGFSWSRALKELTSSMHKLIDVWLSQTTCVTYFHFAAGYHKSMTWLSTFASVSIAVGPPLVCLYFMVASSQQHEPSLGLRRPNLLHRSQTVGYYIPFSHQVLSLTLSIIGMQLDSLVMSVPSCNSNFPHIEEDTTTLTNQIKDCSPTSPAASSG